MAERIEGLRREQGLPVKTLTEALGMDSATWSRKIRGDRSTFTVEEIGAIADLLEAPPGWPFIEKREGELVAAARVRPPR